jgi:adenine-specific DNA glycosylase
MKKRCCRSTPRCARCPVRAAAAARKEASGHEAAALVSEILASARMRTLPQSVATALAQLEFARTR